MAIDGCERSFEELAHEVLPGYMKTLRQRMKSPIPMSLFAIKGVGVATLLKRLDLKSDPRACYVFMDGSQPVYVGISKCVITRLHEHIRGTDHLTATLAYRVAVTEHPHGTTAAIAIKDPAFRMHFDAARERVQSFTAAFVEIENPLELYVFEAYCAMELDTGFDAAGWNTFVTH